MVCSSFAILISLFNLVMCAQNEFDPIILEKELQKRRDADQERQDKIDAENKAIAMEKKKEALKLGMMKSASVANNKDGLEVPEMNKAASAAIVLRKPKEEKKSFLSIFRKQ